MVSRPGKPHDTVNVEEVHGIKIDSAFIGSCTNGRMADMQEAAGILKNRKVAPGVVLKIVPATDDIWKQCLELGLLAIFKKAGALVSNSGCAGCAAGQVGQNGPGEITISTGNRNFPGKQGNGSVYLASPAIVAASSVAGHITTPEKIPEVPSVFMKAEKSKDPSLKNMDQIPESPKASVIEGSIWLVPYDNIDTDMIFHNRYLAITDKKEMAQHTFENLNGFEDFSKKAKPGDIVIAGKNFGCGSSRQQAVDCLSALGIQAVIAESFGVIYERNAINAAFPIILCENISKMDIKNGDKLRVNLTTGEIINNRNKLLFSAQPFSDVQFEIYQQGGLLGRSPDCF